MDCRNALREAGKAGVEKRAGRSATQGVVDAYLHTPDPNLPPKLGVLVELDCETDFVAKTDEFQRLAHEIALHIAVADPSYMSRNDVPDDVVNREREIYASQAQGKPDHIVEKIVDGQIQKWSQEVALLEQEHIRSDRYEGKTIEEMRAEIASKTGENVVVARFAHFRVGEGE